jgi:hypothetical protein
MRLLPEQNVMLEEDWNVLELQVEHWDDVALHVVSQAAVSFVADRSRIKNGNGHGENPVALVVSLRFNALPRDSVPR